MIFIKADETTPDSNPEAQTIAPPIGDQNKPAETVVEDLEEGKTEEKKEAPKASTKTEEEDDDAILKAYQDAAK